MIVVIPQGSLQLSEQFSQARAKILIRHSESAEADRMILGIENRASSIQHQ
jgi:hypothetical protein